MTCPLLVPAQVRNYGASPRGWPVGSERTSRVGGAAQRKIMKKLSGTMRLELAQYRELAAFAQFGSDLDKATQDQLARGERLVETLKQAQYKPLDVAVQAICIFAATERQQADSADSFIRSIAAKDIVRFMGDLEQHLLDNHPGLLAQIADEGELSADVRNKIEELLHAFKAQWS